MDAFRAAYVDPVRWLSVYNTDGDAIPPYGAVVLTGMKTANVFNVGRPTISGQTDVLFNGATPILAAGYGKATPNLPASAAVNNDGTASAVGNVWGTEAGSWTLTRRYPGFETLSVSGTLGVALVGAQSRQYTALVKITGALNAAGRYPAKVEYYDPWAKTITDGPNIWVVDLGRLATAQAQLLGNAEGRLVYGLALAAPSAQPPLVSLTGNTNDLALPAGAAGLPVIQITANGNYNLTGLAAGYLGQVQTFEVVSSSSNITLTNQDAASAAGNQFNISSGQSLTVQANGQFTLAYVYRTGAATPTWQVITASNLGMFGTAMTAASGQTLTIASGATIIAAAGATVTGFGAGFTTPQYLSGGAATQFYIAGRLRGNAAFTQTFLAVTAGDLVAVPFLCERSGTLADVSISVVGVPAGNARFGLYASASGTSPKPGALIRDFGAQSLVGAGGTIMTWTSGDAVVAGTLYWVAWIVDAGAASVTNVECMDPRDAEDDSQGWQFTPNIQPNKCFGYYKTGGAYGALSGFDPFPAGTINGASATYYNTTNIAAVGLRFSA